MAVSFIGWPPGFDCWERASGTPAVPGAAGGFTGPAGCGLFDCNSTKTRSIARSIGTPTTPLLLSTQRYCVRTF